MQKHTGLDPSDKRTGASSDKPLVMGQIKFRLEGGEGLGDEVKSKLRQQLEQVLVLCDSQPNDLEKSVHEIRRSFKKCRSLIRLVRDKVGFIAYFRENRNMRDLQRLLSPARDTTIFCKYLEDFHENYARETSGPWWEKVVADAENRRRQAYLDVSESDALGKVERGAREAMHHVENYYLNYRGFAVAEKGLKRIYRQGMLLSGSVFDQELDGTTIHNFRKRAKYLQYQLEFLGPVFPGLLKPTVKTFKRMTDLLGVYHDLELMSARLPEHITPDQESRKKLDHLLHPLNGERARTLEKVRKLVPGLYAEKPARFVSRIESYWKAYQSGLKGS